MIAEERKRQQQLVKELEAATKKRSKAVSELNHAKATRMIEEFISKGKDVYKEEDIKSVPISTLKLLYQWWKQQKKIPTKKDSVAIWYVDASQECPSCRAFLEGL